MGRTNRVDPHTVRRSAARPVRRLTRETSRLRLTALTAEALDAWMNGDAARLEAETGVVFPDPVDTPPLFDDDLPVFRERMLEEPSELGWWVWVVSRLEDGRAVGVCGLGGRPLDGRAFLGYSVYPRFESQGFATEAAGSLVEWAFDQPGTRSVGAIVPIWNPRSVAVARKLGMTEVGRDVDPDAGDVVIFEIGREAHLA